MCGFNAARPQSDGGEVNWTCPRGHHETDDAPLPPRVFCAGCDAEKRDPFHERDEVTVRGAGRPTAVAGEVAYA